MTVATILSGIGCAAAVWLARKDDTRMTLAFALLYVWIVATFAYHVDALLVLAVVDVLVASLASRIPNTPAADEVVVLSAARVLLHFTMAVGAPYEPVAWAYNLTFAVMLASVASDRGIICGARDCLRALRGRGDGDRGGPLQYLASHSMAEA